MKKKTYRIMNFFFLILLLIKYIICYEFTFGEANMNSENVQRKKGLILLIVEDV